MWEPTTIECRIAAAVLQEYAERHGGNVPSHARRGDSWDVNRFIHNIFSLLAEAQDDSDDLYPPWERLTYKQHCAFWHVVADYEWETLGEYKDIIKTVVF